MVPDCPLRPPLAQVRRNTRAASVEERELRYKEWYLLQWGIGRKYRHQRAHRVVRMRVRCSKPYEKWTRVWSHWICWPFQSVMRNLQIFCISAQGRWGEARHDSSTVRAAFVLHTSDTWGCLSFLPWLTLRVMCELGPCILAMFASFIHYSHLFWQVFFLTRLYLWIILNEEQMCSSSTARYNFLRFNADWIWIWLLIYVTYGSSKKIRQFYRV